MKRYRFFVVLLLVTLRVTGQEQAQTPISLAPFADSRGHWYGIRDAGNLVNPVPNQPVYPASDIQHIADNILLYQRDNGGWPKNYDMQAILTSAQIDSLTRTKGMTHTTFDNGTTYSHVDYLAQVYCQTGIEKYKAGCLKGIAFILEAQYPNGGWPQYYPIEEGNYSRRITFNDGAFLGVMETLRKVADPSSCYAFVDESLRRRAAEAFRKGVDCILKAQIVSKGRLTVWCQQHDEKTLQPAWARAFEPPAICNGESAAIVRMLMSLDQP
ncbi:MAG: pectate lyase, partial [Marinilabiliales bacterium]|nr:pectate lyase [Marinilabiliales bacterium]